MNVSQAGSNVGVDTSPQQMPTVGGNVDALVDHATPDMLQPPAGYEQGFAERTGVDGSRARAYFLRDTVTPAPKPTPTTSPAPKTPTATPTPSPSPGASPAPPPVERSEPRATPDSEYDGDFVGANRETFQSSTPLAEVPAVRPDAGSLNAPSGERIIYVNGIQTTKDEQAESMQAIANLTGADVVGIHNSTEGFGGDLIESLGDKVDKGSNPAVDTLGDLVLGELTAEPPREIHLMSHSQGALVTSRALGDVRRELQMHYRGDAGEVDRRMSMIRVETFGGAAAHYPDGPQYVHYVNEADPVPMDFGLGGFDRFNPFTDPGKDAEVHRFREDENNWKFDNYGANHSFDDIYLAWRVDFEQARQGDFDRP